MAVGTTVTSANFVGTGVSSVYAPGFYVNDSAQVVVTVNGVLKTIGDDYVVNSVGAAAGCNIVGTFTAGAAVFIERVTPITQLVDTQNNETILEDVLDAEFDKLTMIAQELSGKADRAILFPKGESGQVLPAPASRADKYLGFDAVGAFALLLGGGLAAGDANLVSWLRSAIGAVTRTVKSKLEEVQFSVKDFGAVGDGVANDTAAITAAITAATTAGGGVVFFPRGTYNITGTLTVAAGKITLRGEGKDATNLLFANGAADCIVMNNGTTQLYRSNIYDMTITGSAKTGGRALYIAYFANCNIERVDFQNVYTGIDIFVTNTITLRDILINGITWASGYGIYWHAPSNGSARSDVLNCLNVIIQANFSGADGVIWDGLCQTLNWLCGGILATKRGLWVRNTGASVGNVPGFLEAIGLPIEGAINQAVRIEGGYQFKFVDAIITNRVGGNGNADDYAVYIADDAGFSITNSIWFDSCRIGLCGKEAVYCAARSVRFSNCAFPTAGLAAANTYPGVHLVSPAQDIVITGCQDTEWGSNNQTNYSLQIDAGVARVQATANYFGAGVTGAVLNNSGDGNIGVGEANGSAKQQTAASRGVPQANGTGAGTALTAQQLLAPILLRSGPGANYVDTTPTAANIVGQMAAPAVNQIYLLRIANTTAFQQTIQPGAGVTFGGNVSGGNFVLPAGTTRQLVLQVTNCAAGTQAVAIYG